MWTLFQTELRFLLFSRCKNVTSAFFSPQGKDKLFGPNQIEFESMRYKQIISVGIKFLLIGGWHAEAQKGAAQMHLEF